MAVCRYWRHVALDLQSLWAGIMMNLYFLNYPPFNAARIDTISQFTIHCLARSVVHPLTFYFLTNISHRSLSPILETLFEHSSRWEDVTFGMTSLISHGGGVLHVPKLRALKLIDNLSRDSNPLNIFQGAPLLTCLELACIRCPTIRLQLPWIQITHFTSFRSHYRPGEFIQVLQSMPNLIFLETSRDSDLLNMGCTICYLPYLRTLKVDHTDRLIPRVFELLVAPELEHLELDTTSHPTHPVDISKATVDFLHRSAQNRKATTGGPLLPPNNLKTLSLRNVPSHSALRIFEAVPGLTTLELHSRNRLVFKDEASWRDQHCEILQNLTFQRQDVCHSALARIILPNLRHIIMYDSPELNALIGMVSSRSRLEHHDQDYGVQSSFRNVGFRSVRLFYRRSIDPLIVDILSPLRNKDGLELYTQFEYKG